MNFESCGASGANARGFRWWGLAGALVFAAGLLNLLEDVPVWNAIWYLPAWYGYLLVLDSILFRIAGRSFVGSSRRDLAAMMFWSVPFWFFFEACNLALTNWSYVFVLRTPAAEAAVSLFAFATVLPACLLHAELAGALGLWNGARGRAWKLGRRAGAFCLGGGIVCAAAPLIWPRFGFPLVWFAPLLLCESLTARFGAPSLLRDLEEGRRERIARLLTGGLWAGGAWELFNFWARSKWIYTVPGFERWKIFEMPVPGYLGFPALALSAFSFFSAVSLLRRQRTDARGARAAGMGFRSLALASILFSAVTLHFVLQRTVVSKRPLLSELAALGPDSTGRLRAAGVTSPERLLRAVAREGVAGVARRTGIPAPRLARAATESSLAVHKGMGIPFARMLERAGAGSVPLLARANPDELYRRLVSIAGTGERLPSAAMVRVWVRAARPDGRPRR